jgi:hypothetical protein
MIYHYVKGENEREMDSQLFLWRNNDITESLN